VHPSSKPYPIHTRFFFGSAFGTSIASILVCPLSSFLVEEEIYKRFIFLGQTISFGIFAFQE